MRASGSIARPAPLQCRGNPAIEYDDCNLKGLPQSEIGARLTLEADHDHGV